jgi:carboxylesterase type B
MCAQAMSHFNGTPGSLGVEDCLQLNVYSSDLEGNAPVMVGKLFGKPLSEYNFTIHYL